MSLNTISWSPDSWKEKKAKHQPVYKNSDDVDHAIKKIEKFPPLVFAGEARKLERDLTEVANGNAFYYKEVIARKVSQNFTQIK